MGIKSKRKPLWFLPMGSNPEETKLILLTAHRILLYAGYKCKKVDGIFLTYRRGTRRKIELPFRGGIPEEIKIHLRKVKPRGFKQ